MNNVSAWVYGICCGALGHHVDFKCATGGYMGKLIGALVLIIISFVILKWVFAMAMTLLMWGMVALGFLAVGSIAVKLIVDKGGK